MQSFIETMIIYEIIWWYETLIFILPENEKQNYKRKINEKKKKWRITGKNKYYAFIKEINWIKRYNISIFNIKHNKVLQIIIMIISLLVLVSSWSLSAWKVFQNSPFVRLLVRFLYILDGFWKFYWVICNQADQTLFQQ